MQHVSDVPTADNTLYSIGSDGAVKFNLHAGQMRAWNSEKRIVAVIAGTQSGKALALDTPIPTTRGLVPMGDLEAGEQVFDERGQPCTVDYVSPVYADRECYCVEFSDGGRIVADAEHLWSTTTAQERKDGAAEHVRATKLVANTVNLHHAVDSRNPRYVVSAERVSTVPVRCIAVDSPKHLYLAGETGVPTHNTTYGPIWLMREMQRRGAGDYLVVTPTFKLLSLKLYPEFIRLFKQVCNWGDFTGRGNFQSRFLLNSRGERQLFGTEQAVRTQVFFGHAQDPDSLESATAKAVWCDEAGQRKFKVGSWEAVLRRGSIHRARILVTTTPYGLGWMKSQLYDPWRKARAAGEPHPTVDVIQFKSTENPAFPMEEYLERKKTMPLWKHRMFYDGEFDRPAGSIYDCFDEDSHKIRAEELPADWRRLVGLDFGGVHTAAVFLAAERAASGAETGRYHVYREYPPKGDWRSMTAKNHVQELLRGEPRRPAAFGGAGSEDQWRDEFRHGGLPVGEPPVKDVEVGIDRVYGMIKAGNLLVHECCTGLVDELQSYTREVDDAGNPTEKIEDKETFHLLDALRYIASHIMQKKVKVWVK